MSYTKYFTVRISLFALPHLRAELLDWAFDQLLSCFIPFAPSCLFLMNEIAKMHSKPLSAVRYRQESRRLFKKRIVLGRE